MFGGGGFMPSQNQNAGGSPAQKKFASGKAETLRAVTVKQLADALNAAVDDTYFVDGVELANVTLIGKIVKISFTDQLAQMEINDCTGTASVQMWVDQADEDAAADWRVGVYVRVHGKISDFDNKKRINAWQIRPITDFNEVTYHLLKCIFQHVHLTKTNGGSGGGAAAAAPAFAGGAAVARGAGGANEVGDDGFTGVQRDVAAFYKSPEAIGGQGVHNDQVVSALAGTYTRPQVQAAIDFLKDQGHLFTTMDDDHCMWCS
ncbi:hypothetical protein WJX81_007708 [Elliptochloris bilobata]|uniref:Uncharacterized protein n=1 Tax=Elliptochloris bilobata TaxID=381761 RepID=A0AAW1RDX7_9CHLO